MTNYAPHIVARVTHANTGKTFVAIRGGGRDRVPGWYSAEMGFNSDEMISDVRPLVVLDPADSPLGEMRDRSPERMRTYAKHVEDSGAYTAADVLCWIADQIEEQMKSARIEEPAGAWAVVEARTFSFGEPTSALRWVKHTDGEWFTAGDGKWSPDPRKWSDLIDPVLVREGVDV